MLILRSIVLDLARSFTLLGVILGSSSVSAAPAVAILVDVEGRLDPPIAPGAELPLGQTVSLSGNSTVNFVHYATCEFVSLRGGKLTLNAKDYQVAGGTVLQKLPASCPSARRTLARAGEASGIGGLRVRGESPPQRVTARPRIIIAGAAAAEIVAIEVVEAARRVARLPVENGRTVWPASLPPLTANELYTVRFIRPHGPEKIAKIVVSEDLTPDARSPTIFALD